MQSSTTHLKTFPSATPSSTTTSLNTTKTTTTTSTASSSNGSPITSLKTYLQQNPIQVACAAAGTLLSTALIYWYWLYRKQQIQGRNKHTKKTSKNDFTSSSSTLTKKLAGDNLNIDQLTQKLKQIPEDFVEQLQHAQERVMNTQSLDEEFNVLALKYIHILGETAAALTTYEEQQQGEKETSTSNTTSKSSTSISADTADVYRSYITPQMCHDCIQWIIIYYTIQQGLQLQESQSEGGNVVASRLEYEQKMRKDMEFAWHLLNYYENHYNIQSANDDEVKKAVIQSLNIPNRTVEDMQLLGLELAQRVNRSEFVPRIYESLQQAYENATEAEITSPDSRREEQLLALFMNAPQLGKWNEVKRYGQHLTEMKGTELFEQFHHASLQQGFLPDYKVLFDRAQQYGNKWSKASPRERELLYEQYNISSVLLTHDTSRSAIPELAASAIEQLRQEPPISFDVGPDENIFVRTGAVARMISPHPALSLPLSGLCLNKSFFLFAYAQVRQEEGGPISRLEIELDASLESDINNGAERTYVGKLYLRDFSEFGESGRSDLNLEHQYSLELTMKRRHQ